MIEIDISGIADLTEEQKANALFSIISSAGLKVVLWLMEDACLDSETALFKLRALSPEVTGAHAVASAHRDMFAAVQRKIQYLVEEGRLPETSASQMSLEDRASQNAEPLISLEQ